MKTKNCETDYCLVCEKSFDECEYCEDNICRDCYFTEASNYYDCYPDPYENETFFGFDQFGQMAFA